MGDTDRADREAAEIAYGGGRTRSEPKDLSAQRPGPHYKDQPKPPPGGRLTRFYELARGRRLTAAEKNEIGRNGGSNA
jgi:hypothetical protein